MHFKKVKSTPKNKIMLSAHTDEVGMIVTGVTDDGMLRFATVGGVNSKVILGRAVKVSEENTIGVIGVKAVHMQTDDEKNTAMSEDKLYIDIGAKDKEDALNHISLGDSVCFIGDYKEFGDGFIKAKAIDDRVGVRMLIEMI